MSTFKIFLRAFKSDDYLLINKWRNDKNLQQLTGGSFYYISMEKDQQWLSDKMKFSQKEIYCSICLKETEQMIGYISLNDIDLIHRKCVWGGLVIGEPNMYRKNIGFTAAFLIMQYAFDQLNLNRIMAFSIESHIASVKLMHKLNFKKEGTLRKSLYKNGQWYNQTVFSLLKDEFEEFYKSLDKEFQKELDGNNLMN